MELPVYKVKLNEENYGVYTTSIVKNPATKSAGIFMSEEVAPTFYESKEKKGVFLGAVLVPDRKIYREIDGKPLWLMFDADVIRDIHTKMHQTGSVHNFSIGHSLQVRKGITYLESWVKESEEDKSVAYGIDEPIGTMFMEVKIENDIVKSLIEDGKLQGFSVELDAAMVKVELEEEKVEFKNIAKFSDMEVSYNELKENEVVSVKDVESFSGEFEVENKIVKVEDNKIVELKEVKKEEPKPIEFDAEKLVNDIAEKLQSAFTTQLEDVKKSLESDLATKFEEKLSTVETVIAEFKLQSLQEFAELRKKGNEIELEEETRGFDPEAYRLASKWGRK